MFNPLKIFNREPSVSYICIYEIITWKDCTSQTLLNPTYYTEELILPHTKRLAEASNRMVELPLALYESQDLLLKEIVGKGKDRIKRGLILLGGIQINTGPSTSDYFLPLRFEYITDQGENVIDLLPKLTKYL
jgi:hypothetical protein